MRIQDIPLTRRRTARRERRDVFQVLAGGIRALNALLFGEWTAEDEAHFEATRKELLDEYSPAERRQMAAEGAARKKEFEDGVAWAHEYDAWNSDNFQ